MRRFKITIAYDGTDFQGWQSQPHKITICDYLQKQFKSVFNHDVTIIGASRTDSNVHALGQVALIKTDLSIPSDRILNAWNNILSDSVYIRSIEKVSPSFYPMNNVQYKVYYYNLFLKRPMPFVARYGWLYEQINEVDLLVFQDVLQLYLGTHDFRSFCKLEEAKDTVRTIDRISIRRIPSLGIFQVILVGKSFLRFQIRRMIGYALDASRSPKTARDKIKNILQNPEPIQTLVKADGKGLILRKIVYYE